MNTLPPPGPPGKTSDAGSSADAGFVRRMRRARRWVVFAGGRWRPIRPRVAWCEWNWSVLFDSLLWGTFRSAARAAADPSTEMLGVALDDGRVVPIAPALVRAVAAGVRA